MGSIEKISEKFQIAINRPTLLLSVYFSVNSNSIKKAGRFRVSQISFRGSIYQEY